MDRGVWQAPVHKVIQGQTWQRSARMRACTHIHTHTRFLINCSSSNMGKLKCGKRILRWFFQDPKAPVKIPWWDPTLHLTPVQWYFYSWSPFQIWKSQDHSYPSLMSVRGTVHVSALGIALLLHGLMPSSGVDIILIWGTVPFWRKSPW